jgi:hypothetical protein
LAVIATAMIEFILAPFQAERLPGARDAQFGLLTRAILDQAERAIGPREILGANKAPVYSGRVEFPGEGETRPEIAYSAAYAVCAVLAFSASRARANGPAPFWLRIAVICAVFALLRFVGAQMAVNDAFTDFSRSTGLHDWERPGLYIMIGATLAFGAAAAGLVLFGLRGLHRSVVVSAAAIVALVLLALAHSLSLYVPNRILQTDVGPLTVSRIIEALLLLTLASSTFWFIRDAQGGRTQSA